MENREIERLLTQIMSAEHSELQAPDPLLVFEARQAVINRKRRVSFPRETVMPLRRFFSALRLQHLGVTAILVLSGLLYLSQAWYNPHHRQTATYDYNSLMSSGNSTISVISSTMLTSIPTLRN
jgi:hypothetical protein